MILEIRKYYLTIKVQDGIIYEGVIFDCFQEKEEDGYNAWANICAKCVQIHGIPKNVLSDGVANESICGVRGCGNESDFYIDFEKGGSRHFSHKTPLKNFYTWHEQRVTAKHDYGKPSIKTK